MMLYKHWKVTAACRGDRSIKAVFEADLEIWLARQAHQFHIQNYSSYTSSLLVHCQWPRGHIDQLCLKKNP